MYSAKVITRTIRGDEGGASWPRSLVGLEVLGAVPVTARLAPKAR